MAKESVLAGTTSHSVNVFIQDSSSTTGAGLSGLVFNTSGLIAYYTFTGANATATQITLATLAAVNSAFSSGGFKELDATNMKGTYRLDLPNAAIAASKGQTVTIQLGGATNMAPCVLEIELTAWNNQDGVRGGMTAMPNAAASAIGGLLTAPTTANVGLADLSRILGTALTETAGQIAAAFKKFFDKATPTGTINSLPDAVPGAAGGLLVDDVWTDARAAKLDNLDVAVSTRGTGTALDAAGVRSAVGLGSANLDTQLSGISSKTTNLPPDPADASDISGLFTALTSHGDSTWATATGFAVPGSAMALTSAAQQAAADALLGRNVAGGSSAGRLVKEALYTLRNKVDIPNGIVYGVDDTTPAFNFTVTTAAGNPVTVYDPA